MDHVYAQKQRFVDGKLAPFIEALSHGAVEGLEYELAKEEEFVLVKYRNRHTRQVCVTGDSLKALTLDVLRVV